MSTKTLHGQMSVVDKEGNTQLLHQETSAEDVLVTTSTNTKGTDGKSAIPSDVDNIQKLTDKFGTLAFKSKVGFEDLSDDLIAKDITTATETQIPSAVIVKELNEKVDETLEKVDNTLESMGGAVESIIKDGEVSPSSTWSSDKIYTNITEVNNRVNQISDEIDAINQDIDNINDSIENVNTKIDGVTETVQNIVSDAASVSILQIELVKNGDTYTSSKTVAEIEAAYQEHRSLWVVIDSNLNFPLRKRQDANTWIFGGYTENEMYDVTIKNENVTVSTYETVTSNGSLPNPYSLKFTGAVSAMYDGSTEVIVDIPAGGSEEGGTTVTLKSWTSSDGTA